MTNGTERSQPMEKAQWLRALTQPMVKALQQVSGLDDFQAKTCVYYSIATHGLETLPWFPILVFRGPPGTGKSQAMAAMKHLVRDPRWMSSTPTPSILRQKLGHHTTVFIEEGDKVDEELILNRYSRDTAMADWNRSVRPGVYAPTHTDFFGGTVLHRRLGFRDSGTASRAIAIKTRMRTRDYATVDAMESELADLGKHAKRIWEECSFKPERRGRAEDVWAVPAIVAAKLGDFEWVRQCTREIEKQRKRLVNGASYEPDQMILSALIANYKGAMVPLKDIRNWLRDEFGWQPSPWQLADAVRDLGFEVKTSGGHRKVKVDKQLLIDKAQELGIEDDELDRLGLPKIRGLE